MGELTRATISYMQSRALPVEVERSSTIHERGSNWHNVSRMLLFIVKMNN